MTALLALLAQAFPPLGAWARRVWCRRQRRRLVGVISTVVWVPADKAPWALWGAEHGFFEAGRAGGLLYLRSSR